MIRFSSFLFGLGVATGALAQDIDNTELLPDARPGECYAKVVAPARFELRTEEIVIREASERIEPVPVRFVEQSEQVLVREADRRIEPIDAVFEPREERVETRPESIRWTLGENAEQPVSPDTIAALGRSNIDTDAAEPGQCFTEYYSDIRYATESIDVRTRDASERVVVSAAEYQTIETRQLVRETSTRVVDVPAIYRVETRSVQVEPARSEWKPGRGLIERVDNTTGEIMCLVEIPARFESVQRTVLERPASTKTVEVPAAYRTVDVERLVKPASEAREPVSAEFTRVPVDRVVAEPAFRWQPAGTDAPSDMQATGRTVCKTLFPARHQTITRQALVRAATSRSTPIAEKHLDISVARVATAATERRIPIPARTRRVTSRVQVEPSRLEWRRVLCETNMTEGIVRDLQAALETAGYDPGPVDGVLGQATLDAVEAFQRARDLDRGGLTYETLDALDVST